VALIKTAIELGGTALIGVIWPCVAFNNHPKATAAEAHRDPRVAKLAQ
jgi:hypothetical protein